MADTPHLARFRSSGHQVGPYVAAGSAADRQEFALDRASHTRVAIADDNVGFRLLVKSGWRPGQGLGREESGRREPISAQANAGNRGIGHAPAPRPALKKASKPPQPPQPQQPQQPQQQEATSARMAKLAADELAEETLDAKVKRHKQLERTEAEQARGRAIERYLRAAFNDPFDPSDNQNVLARPHKLTSSNPLLDTFD